MVHCLSKTVTDTVNVEGYGGTSVHQQCHSSAGIGGPRWYVQSQKMSILKLAAGTLTVATHRICVPKIVKYTRAVSP